MVENSAKGRQFHRVLAMNATEREVRSLLTVGAGGVLHCQPSLDWKGQHSHSGMAHPVKLPQVFVTQPGTQFGASSAIPSEGSAIDKTILRSKSALYFSSSKPNGLFKPFLTSL